MDVNEYTKMVDSQIEEAKVTMEMAEKKFRKEKAKYELLLSLKETYDKWVIKK